MSRNIKIAILINDPYLNTLAPLFRELSTDERFDVKVWACARLGYDFSPEVSSAVISNLLKLHGIPHELDPTREVIAGFEPDFVFTSNPYDIYISSELDSGWLSQLTRLAHISYGATLLEWTGDYEFLSKNPFIERAYRIYTETSLIHQERQNFSPIGYAKLTDYMEGSRKPLTFPLRSIAWKPRWTKHSETSLLEMIDVFRNLSQRYVINLVIHPMLLQNNPGQAAAALRDLALRETVNEVKEHDFLDYVLGSSIYVGDVSSTLAEFTWTNSPVIYTGKLDGLNDLGRAIISTAYVVGASEVEQTIIAIEGGVDPMASKRQNIFQNLFSPTEQTPIEAIRNDLLEVGAISRVVRPPSP